MDHYVTGAAIRSLREKHRMTQAELAEKLCVSDKAVSKWENGRGFPDVSLLESLSKVLHVSVPELLCGQTVLNANRAANILKSRYFVCPVCGNVIFARGDAMISCCGIRLPALEAEEPDPEHLLRTEQVEDEIYVSSDHPMTKEHYLSFLSAVSDQGIQFVKLYPEGNAEARFKKYCIKTLYVYCNRHGLFQVKL